MAVQHQSEGDPSDKAARRVIFDIGANNGDDIPYYLLKSDLVVAVEANEALCAEIGTRFSDAIEAGQLQVVNSAIVAQRTRAAGPIAFYLNDSSHVRSQLDKPARDRAGDFRRVEVTTVTLAELIERFGEPWYVKIDIENHDRIILQDLLERADVPPFLSVEIHGQNVADLLLNDQRYRGFKLVEGSQVASRYREAQIVTPSGVVIHDFPQHSAGPMGDDIHGDWYDSTSMRDLILRDGPGWKDLHASRSHSGQRVTVNVPWKKRYWDYRRRFSAKLPADLVSLKRRLATSFRKEP